MALHLFGSARLLRFGRRFAVRGPGSSRALRLRVTVGLLLACLASVLSSPHGAAAATGDIGYQGPSTSNAGTSPTGSKPESKLWWNDGFWWASMWDTRSKDFHIFKLAQGSQTWTDTGVALDERPSTRADVLWDGAAGKLYVASHRFSESPATGYPSRLYRYTYHPTNDTYTRDQGFPVVINNYRIETLVIDKDSTGRLWATWTQGGKVWVNATVCSPTCSDTSWGTPFSLAVSTIKADDISALIAFGGSHIGVMWSNQNNGTFSFAIHNDGDLDASWAVETPVQGSGMADDHINLKTDADGRVYAAVKTSKTGAGDPLIMLLVRPTGGGTWSSSVFGRVSDHHTRPMVVLDEQDGLIHMFATSADLGGSIMEKTSPIDTISFEPGVGTEVIKDADGLVNDAASMKRSVNPATGLVVVASSNQKFYFHLFETLGGGGPTPPIASFDATPESGVEPLDVQFTDTSSGTIDSWAWDFDNDGTVDSTDQNASWTYGAGTWTAKLTVSNAAGPDSATASIVVTPAGGGGSALTFMPTDDAYVKSSTPNTTSGADPTLRVVTSTSETQSYLRFVVSGTTAPLTSATLRLFVVDGNATSGNVYSVPETPWTEGTLTFGTKPPVGALVAGAQAAPLGTWIEFDLSAFVTGDGTYSLAIKDGSTGTAWYSSKEGANPPQLVVTSGS
jgi:PKD repeat protein